MSRSPRPGIPAFAARAALCAGTALLLAYPAFAQKYPGVGRAATPDVVKAWDIDVRPDFKGLPPGSGSVAKGQEVWEGKCASCHGTFGESNEVFTPIVGGTSAEDIKSGRVGTLVTGDVSRTTFMKLSTISTLWDYVRRAMPWNAPKSLTYDEVYAVVAFMLNLADIVPADFVLDERSIRQAQERLPNRKGMTRNHGLGDVKGKPDVVNVACMKDCATQATPGKALPGSALPEHARGSHGNLKQQNREVGPVRGADTTVPAATPVGEPKVAIAAPLALPELARQKACLACHAVERRIVGPSLREVAARYQGQAGAEAKLVEKVRRGGSGIWGSIPMPPNPDLSEADAIVLVQWILAGAK